jgi:ATP phosphoribosyltransferase
VNGALTLALPKGRVLDEAVTLLGEVGIDVRVVQSDSRRLVFEVPGWRVLVVRGSDVPTYVEGGAADVGIAGQDVLLERGADLYEPLDLRIGWCRLVVAEPEDRPVREEAMAHLRVATKYPEITRRHFLERGRQVDIIPLHGAIELAPLVGLSDWIVDLTASGETLRQNRLRIVEEILPITSRLIVNRASLKTRAAQLRSLLTALEAAVKRREAAP